MRILRLVTAVGLGFGLLVSPVYADGSAVRIVVEPTVGVIEGNALYGASGSLLFRMGSPLFVGMELGVFGFSKPLANQQLNMVPILGTALYQFTVNSEVYLHIGASIGIASQYGDVRNALGVPSPLASTEKLHILLRPGIEVYLSRYISLIVEPKFGFQGDVFFYMPQIGFVNHL